MVLCGSVCYLRTNLLDLCSEILVTREPEEETSYGVCQTEAVQAFKICSLLGQTRAY